MTNAEKIHAALRENSANLDNQRDFINGRLGNDAIGRSGVPSEGAAFVLVGLLIERALLWNALGAIETGEATGGMYHGDGIAVRGR